MHAKQFTSILYTTSTVLARLVTAPILHCIPTNSIDSAEVTHVNICLIFWNNTFDPQQSSCIAASLLIQSRYTLPCTTYRHAYLLHLSGSFRTIRPKYMQASTTTADLSIPVYIETFRSEQSRMTPMLLQLFNPLQHLQHSHMPAISWTILHISSLGWSS